MRRKKLPFLQSLQIPLVLVPVLMFFLLIAVRADAATPNPGHSWTEVGDGTFSVSGPTSLHTFTFPNANATVLTTNTAVSTGQGGTGFSTYAVGDLLFATSTSALAKLNAGMAGQVLTMSGGTPTWMTPSSSSQWVTSGSDINYVAGNVGLGTTSPSSVLHVKGSDIIAKFEVTNNSRDGVYIGNGSMFSGDEAGLYDVGSDFPLAVFDATNNVAHYGSLSIKEDNVGIGTSTPQYALDIYSADNASGAIAANRGRFGERSNNSVQIGYDVLGGETGMTWYGNDDLIAGLNSSQTAYKFGGWSDSAGVSVNLASGNVGIRTANPNSYLQVVSDDGSSLLEVGSVSGGRSITLGDISEGSWGPTLTVDGEVGMSYFQKGNVGIGTTTPNCLLTINNPDSYTNAINITGHTVGETIVAIGQGANRAGTISVKNTNSTKVFLNSNGSSYYNGGNLGIGTTTPGEKLEVNGGIKYNTVTAKPVCDATTRATTWFTQGAVGIKDAFEVCAKDAANAYAWRTLY